MDATNIGRRRVLPKTSAEDQALDQIAKEAEARLAAKRQARAEAREIRMRDLERQQKEQEENADRIYDMYADGGTRTAALARISNTKNTMLVNSYQSSRRSSEDSLEDVGSVRDIRHELRELEDKFRKAMIANAQLDNDKAAHTYQIELLKDRVEDLEQDYAQVQREFREKSRAHEQLKRVAQKLRDDLAYAHALLNERDELIAEKGLVIVCYDDDNDVVNSSQNHDNSMDSSKVNGKVNDVDEEDDSLVAKTPRKALVTIENAQVLESVGKGNLDVRLKKVIEEKRELEDEVRSLRLELDDERNKWRKRRSSSLVSNSNSGNTHHNGPEIVEYFDGIDVIDMQREATKHISDYKFKLQKAEQDIATLQANVARLESQVVRYKAAAEASEKAEDELKSERRKLQREARESQSRVEELETANSHLMKRLDKLKNAKSTLLKEL